MTTDIRIVLWPEHALKKWFESGDEPGGRRFCRQTLWCLPVCAWMVLGGGAVYVCARKRGRGASLTFVFSSVLHRFKSRCLHGLLLADEPVKPPSSQLPELRVAGHKPPWAVLLVQGWLLWRIRAHQPGTGAGVLQHPGVCDADPGHPVRHWQCLVSRGPT